MPKFILVALAAGFLGIALLGPAQATNRPDQPSIELLMGLDQFAQSQQVPKECEGIRDPAKLQQCIEKNKGG